MGYNRKVTNKCQKMGGGGVNIRFEGTISAFNGKDREKQQGKKSSRIWRSHSGGYEEFFLLGYSGLHGVMSQKVEVFEKELRMLLSGIRTGYFLNASRKRHSCINTLTFFFSLQKYFEMSKQLHWSIACLHVWGEYFPNGINRLLSVMETLFSFLSHGLNS
jgi:hypothetical protein